MQNVLLCYNGIIVIYILIWGFIFTAYQTYNYYVIHNVIAHNAYDYIVTHYDIFLLDYLEACAKAHCALPPARFRVISNDDDTDDVKVEEKASRKAETENERAPKKQKIQVKGAAAVDPCVHIFLHALSLILYCMQRL